MNTEKIEFKNNDGELLSARLDFPLESKPHSFAIFAHCFTCSKNLPTVKNIARSLNQNGIAVLRFDFTGLGDSEGEFENTNFSSNVEDLVLAAQYLEQNYQAPSLLVGHSLGGAAVYFAAKELPSIKAIASIGAPSNPKHVAHLFKDNLCIIEEKGIAELKIGGRPFTIKKQFLDDLETKEMKEVLSPLRKAILVLHSPQDDIVGIENAAEIYAAAHHPKSFVTLDGADHLLSNKVDSLYAGNVIANWASRYLSTQETDELKTNHQVAVRIQGKGYTTEVKAKEHSFLADEPISVGGNNFGPTPYDLLLASLGACTAMTLKMYIDRKEWTVSEIKVHLNHSKDYATDSSNAQNSDEKIDFIDRTIEIKGELTEQQKEKLLSIADKCPVHKTLDSETKVMTTFA